MCYTTDGLLYQALFPLDFSCHKSKSEDMEAIQAALFKRMFTDKAKSLFRKADRQGELIFHCGLGCILSSILSTNIFQKPQRLNNFHPVDKQRCPFPWDARSMRISWASINEKKPNIKKNPDCLTRKELERPETKRCSYCKTCCFLLKNWSHKWQKKWTQLKKITKKKKTEF